ncbi:MAG: hypothetical protein IKB73_02135 [Ruminococcus sp.]|nr:hypothetical protein [Ruminococcus sp.]
MEDFFEKKLKEFLPYIIIIGAVFLALPAILMLLKNRVVLNQIVLLGVFPLTSFGCCAHYAYVKKSDLYLTLVAPIIFIPTMFLYGFIRDSLLNSLIFLVSYFICGYIGLTVGEMISGKASDDKAENKGGRRTSGSRSRQRRVPRHVDTTAANEESVDDLVIEDIEMPESFDAVHTTADETPSFDSTMSDIDSILAEIHSRNE